MLLNLEQFKKSLPSVKRTLNQTENEHEIKPKKRGKKTRSRTRSARSDSVSSTSSIQSIEDTCVLRSSITSDRYDINNIVIPSNMLTCHKINIVKTPNVPTPKWRELIIEPDLPELDQIESLDDVVYTNRHELVELNERYQTILKTNKIKLCLNKTDQNLEDFKTLIEKLEHESLNTRRNRNCPLTLNQNPQLEADALKEALTCLEWPSRVFPLNDLDCDTRAQTSSSSVTLE